MVQSVPEKTLEHWASIDLHDRFGKGIDLWWTTFGADINVQSLATTPGKSILLELKTTSTSPNSPRHSLYIDRAQLQKYLNKQGKAAAPRPIQRSTTTPSRSLIGSERRTHPSPASGCIHRQSRTHTSDAGHA